MEQMEGGCWAAPTAEVLCDQPSTSRAVHAERTVSVAGREAPYILWSTSEGAEAEAVAQAVAQQQQQQQPACAAPAACARFDVVWLALQTVPSALQEGAVRAVADRICGELGLRVYVLHAESLLPATAVPSLQAWCDDLVGVIQALPLSGRFFLVDDSAGSLTPSLWALHGRLCGAVVLNFAQFYSDEHLTSEAHTKLLNGMGSLQQTMNLPRDDALLAQAKFGLAVCANVPDATEKAAIGEVLRGAYVASSPAFFARLTAFYVWTLDNSITEAMRGKRPIPLHATLVVGALSPVVGVIEANQRLQKLLPRSSIAYIPESMVWWQIEGRHEHVAKIVIDGLAAAVRREGDPSLNGKV